MTRHAWCLALALTGATALAGSARPFDWPQWQGPDRNAVSKERGLLQEWPNGGPPLAWEVKGLGGGYSAPSVAAAIAHAEDPPGGNGRSAVAAAESLDLPGERWAIFRPLLEEAAFPGDGVPVGALPLRPIEGLR